MRRIGTLILAVLAACDFSLCNIPKREVWEAFKKVKANQGAAGVDGQSIADFEADLTNNLYELWNRLSSGSYFPPPVRRVDIPKVDAPVGHSNCR